MEEFQTTGEVQVLTKPELATLMISIQSEDRYETNARTDV